MNIILWIWQLPQHLLALILIKLFKGEKVKTYYKVNPPWEFGVSLGNYILFSTEYINFFKSSPLYEKIVVMHESGHSVQSKMLGPFYLLIVGLVSSLQNLICMFIPNSKYAENYYKRWPENWADKLGGVNRA